MGRKRRDNGYDPKNYKLTKRKERRRFANNGGSSKDKATNIVDKTMSDESKVQARFRDEFGRLGRVTRREANGSYWSPMSPAGEAAFEESMALVRANEALLVLREQLAS